MDNALYEAYRINAKIAGVVYDAENALITREVAKLRILELWGDVKLAGRRMFTPEVVRSFEARLGAAAARLLT